MMNEHSDPLVAEAEKRRKQVADLERVRDMPADQHGLSAIAAGLEREIDRQLDDRERELTRFLYDHAAELGHVPWVRDRFAEQWRADFARFDARILLDSAWKLLAVALTSVEHQIARDPHEFRDALSAMFASRPVEAPVQEMLRRLNDWYHPQEPERERSSGRISARYLVPGDVILIAPSQKTFWRPANKLDIYAFPDQVSSAVVESVREPYYHQLGHRRWAWLTDIVTDRGPLPASTKKCAIILSANVPPPSDATARDGSLGHLGRLGWLLRAGSTRHPISPRTGETDRRPPPPARPPKAPRR